MAGRKTKRILAAAVTLAAVAAAAYFLLSGDDGADAQYIYVKAEQGPLTINLHESGSVKPLEQTIIKSRVEGRHSIIYLIAEGARVRKGDLLVELDVSDIETKRVDQEIVVENAEAAAIIKKEELEVAINQAKADVELAELELRFANEDLEKYREGEYPNQLSEAEGQVTLAEEELERARDKMEWSKKLFDEKYLSESELRSDELSWKRCELNLKTAIGNVELLKNYTYKREIAQLESDVSQKTMALERTKRKANASVCSAEASLKAKNLELNRQKERLAHYEEQISKAKILAPTDGLVIYATSANNRWGNQQPLAEGQEVWERHELIHLPVDSVYQAEVNIHESNLKKIYKGLEARIRVDAIPGRIFKGEVTSISPLPDPQRMWANPDLKVYKTMIKILDGGDLLKSGMNCSAEIIIEQYENVVYVPLQCVVGAGGTNKVWVKTPNGPQPRDVEVGLDNNRFIHIVSGLTAGEEILLTPPLSGSVSRPSDDKPAAEQTAQQPPPGGADKTPPSGSPGGSGAASGGENLEGVSPQ